MKTILFALVAGVALTLCGCSKTESGLDTTKVQAAFSTVPQADQAELQAALTALKAGDYSGALASLQKAAASVKLTPEQKTALEDLLAQVKTRVGAAVQQVTTNAAKLATNVQAQVDSAVKQAGADAGKAAADLQKTLPKP